MCYSFNQECDNNIKMKLIFEAQHYIILTKVVNEAVQTHYLQLHNKLSSAQPALKEVKSFCIFCIIPCF
jgi:hypothetical protein